MKLLALLILLGIFSSIHCGLLRGLAGTLTDGAHKVSEALAIDKEKGNPLTSVVDTLGGAAQDGTKDFENALGLGDKEIPPEKNDNPKPTKKPEDKKDKADNTTTTTQKVETKDAEKKIEDATTKKPEQVDNQTPATQEETTTKKKDVEAVDSSKSPTRKKKRSLDYLSEDLLASNDLPYASEEFMFANDGALDPFIKLNSGPFDRMDFESACLNGYAKSFDGTCQPLTSE